MKKLYVFSSIQLLLMLFAFAPKVYSQCNSTYTTANYFCDLDSLFLTAVPLEGVGPFSFIWETGETTQTITIPLALGDYLFTVTDANGCVIVNNAHIKPFPDVLFYPYAQDACEGDTVTLWLDWFRDSIPGATYLWSTGETTSSIELTDDLVWSVTVTDPSNGCEFVIPPGLFDFHPTPPPQIVGPNMLCNGATITLSVTGGPFGGIVWYDPSGEPHWVETLNVTEPGMYIVWGSSIEANYCWGKDTIVITEGNIIPPLLSGPPELCNGQTGTISVTNFPLFEEFIWSNGMTTSSFTANAPGSYTVTVTDDGGCTASASITVANASQNILTAVPTAATCGQNNGSITISYSIPGTYSFNWSNGSTQQNLINVAGGIYSVTVTAPGGCSSTAQATVPDNQIVFNINESITPNNSCDVFNGAINLNITPALGYSFDWSNGETTEDISGLSPGNFTVTITYGLTCTATETYWVEDISEAPDLVFAIVEESCGEGNGSIDLQLSGGTSPFSFTWSNGQTTEDLQSLSAGTYTVTVTTADGCSGTSSVTLLNTNPLINIAGIIEPNTSCIGSNGSIDVSVSPAGTYSFSWSTGATTEDITGVAAGNYSITVTLGGCSETGSFTVTNASLPYTVTGIQTNNTSCTIPNGSIDLSLIPVGSYNYLWSTGSTDEDLQSLDAGTYTVTVTNMDGCEISSSFLIENLNSTFSISGISTANTSCQVPNGSLDISVSPAGLYDFIWTSGATTEDLQNISAGVYDVIVTNSDGCTASASFTVDDQTQVILLSAIPLPDTSCINPTGSLDLIVNPAGNYTFLWSNGATTEDLITLTGGNYQVTVSDQNSCSSTASFIVDDNTSEPFLSATILNEVCGGANGTIDLNVVPSGNTFSWSNGATTEDLVNLSSGAYIVIVTGGNGCSATDTFDITNTSNSFTLSAVTTDNTSCIASNGAIDLVVNPTGSYSFTWSNGNLVEDLVNLDAGTYTVTVVDNLNCSSTASFNIQSLSQNPVISDLITPASCGQSNGNISLTVIPPTGNAYTWSNGAITEDLQYLNAGSYSVTVTSNNGCSSFASFMVPDNNSNLSVSGMITNNTSCISSNGMIDISVTPAGIYSYVWSNGATSPSLQNLPAGVYSVTVTDTFNCSSSESYIIADFTIFPVIAVNLTPASCGQSNGLINIVVTQTNNNSFIWSNGSTSEDLINVSSGAYHVTVTSQNGCTSFADIVVPNQNSNFSITSSISDDTSCIYQTGAIDLSVLPLGTYSFVWSNGATTEDLTNLISGIYEVTVTDPFSCAFIETFIIENTAVFPLISEIMTMATCGESNGSINLTVNPSSGNQFVWSTGHITEDVSNLAEGSYSVTVTDASGCTATGNYLVPGTTPIQIILNADLSSIPIGGTVLCSLELNVPLSTIQSITWSPDDLLSCHSPLCLEQSITIFKQTEVIVMVMDTNGCISEASLLFDVDKQFRVYIPNVFRPDNDGINDRFTIYANVEVEEVEILEIFDRWGNCVFKNGHFPPNEPNYGWDGIYKDLMMNPDVFAYRAVVRYSNGELHSFKGDVTLVR